MEWYYAKDGQQHGPVTEGTLQDLFQHGTVQDSDLVWNESLTNWVPLSSILGFGSQPVPSLAPSGIPVAPPAGVASPVHTRAISGGQPAPPTYLWQSIVCVLLCCWPLAIPAIVFGTKVNPAMEAGDYGSALEASNKARMWCLVSLILGIIFHTAVIGFVILAGVTEAAKTVP